MWHNRGGSYRGVPLLCSQACWNLQGKKKKKAAKNPHRAWTNFKSIDISHLYFFFICLHMVCWKDFGHFQNFLLVAFFANCKKNPKMAAKIDNFFIGTYCMRVTHDLYHFLVCWDNLCGQNDGSRSINVKKGHLHRTSCAKSGTVILGNGLP